MIRSSRGFSGDRISVSRVLCYLLFALLGYAAWARGGVYPPWQWPMASLSVFLLAAGAIFFDSDRKQKLRNALLRDPVAYIGAVFILILFVQGLNSGYLVVWDTVDSVGMVREPVWWLPWSVEPETASQMINWFFPAWVCILLIRHLLERKEIKLLLYLLVWNAAVLAIVGIVQYLAQAKTMLGLWEIPGNHFFATFGYVNHGAAWFYLHAALAAGLAHDGLIKRKPPVQIAVWCGSFLLCITATFLTLSRAGAIGAVVLLLVVAGLLIRWTLKKSKGSAVLNAAGLAVIVVLAGAALYFSAGEGGLAQEIEETFLGEGMAQTVTDRTMQLPSAWAVAKEYPVFGCGGWGYRWVAMLHIPIEEWPAWRSAGKANVHCDPLQFLVEFGWVGILCMLSTVGVLIRSALKLGKPDALRSWIALGLFLVFLHGWVDLPFRSPAILMAWCLLFAVLGRLTSKKHYLL